MSTSPEPRKSEERERVLIGTIVGAHGVKGTLRIHPLTDYPTRFFDMKKLYLEKPGKQHRELEILKVAGHEGKGQILVTVAGITDRDRAEELSGYLITVAPDERVELPEDEYWIDSLIGMNVIDVEDGALLGKIEDVMSTGSSDLYQVRTPEGEAKIIPAIADVVRQIDVETGEMKVSLIEGLWD